MTDQEARDEREALIAEARALLAYAADAAPRSARAAIMAGDVEDQRLSLIARLADALCQSPTLEATEEAVTRATSIIESVYGRQVADTSAVARAILAAGDRKQPAPEVTDEVAETALDRLTILDHEVTDEMVDRAVQIMLNEGLSGRTWQGYARAVLEAALNNKETQ